MTDLLELSEPAAPRTSPLHGPRLRALVARFAGPVLGVGAAVALGIGAGRPSYWGDEAASVISAERPWPSLVRELSQVDAVHGLYYAFLHAWISLFGATEWATRAPSVIAAGLAVWGVVSLGRRLLGLRVGLIAGGVLAILPEFTRIAIEARSYAGAVAAGVWLTVFLVHLLGRATAARRERLEWVLYAAGLVGAIVLFEFDAFLVVVHLGLLWALRADRTAWRRWLAALGLTALPLAAFGVVSYLERGQIAFLSNHAYGSPADVLVHQWFRNPVLAALAWALLAAALVLAVRRGGDGRRRALVLAVWALGPTLLLVSINSLVVPVYNQRYLSPGLPAVALLVALGVDSLLHLLRPGRRRALVGAAIGIALVASAVPSIVVQRGPYAKDGGADLRQAAAALHRLAAPGDAVVFTEDVRASERPDLETHLYPQDFTGFDDVELATPAVDRAWLWDERLPVSAVADRLADHRVVWATEVRGHATADLTALEDLGYHVTRTVPVHRSVLYRLEKETP